ncbi:MAG: radical SAM protein, partial [Lentisphaerae bacterium]
LGHVAGGRAAIGKLDVLFIDAVAEGLRHDAIKERLLEFTPQYLILELTIPSLKQDKSFCRWCRETLPSTQILAGGAIPHSIIRPLLDEGLVDYWIRGEYDQALVALVDCLVQGHDGHAVAGVVTRDWDSGSRGYVQHVDSLARPPYECLPMENYRDSVCGLPHPMLQTWFSRGCPFTCSFCVWPQLFYGSRRYRCRDVETGVREIAELVERYNLLSFYIDDDTANIGKRRLFLLAEKLQEYGLSKLPWAMMARADCMHEDVLEALKESGLYSIKYGVESIDPQLANACDKGTRMDRLYRTIEQTRELGIKMHLTFTLGIPGETRDTMFRTLEFALNTAPETAQFSICTPFPGTRFFDECERNGWLRHHNWEDYLGDSRAVIDTPWLPAEVLEETYAEICRCWREFVTNRLEMRREKLIQRLRHLLGQGMQWVFLGDTEFAAFILEDRQLSESRLETEDVQELGQRRDVLGVIVSRHDEEKLYRRLINSNSGWTAQRILKLYSADQS